MAISTIWRRLSGRKRRRRSFYESSDVMRRAVETTGPVDMCLYTDDELRRVLETDMGVLRRQAAEQELANRASRARQQA